jgi:hypothetical protein
MKSINFFYILIIAFLYIIYIYIIDLTKKIFVNDLAKLNWINQIQ